MHPLPIASLLALALSTVAMAQGGAAPADDAQRQEGGDAGRRGAGGGRGMFGGGRGGGMFGPMGRSLDSVTELREQFQPAFLRRDVQLMRDELELDEAQMPIVETLVADYETQFTEASDRAQQRQRDLMQRMFQGFMSGNARERFQESFQKIQADLEQMAVEAGGELPPETRRQYFREQMQKMSEEMAREREASGEAAATREIAGEMVRNSEAWRRERAAMEAKLLEELQAALRDPQRQRWPAFDRFMRREKSLGRGRLSGESVNLFAVVDGAGLAGESVSRLDPLLQEYEIRLDEALKRRNDYLAQNEAKALRAIQESDAKAMEQLADRMIDLRNGVRTVNEESRTAIVAALPSEEGKRVERAALEAAYGRVYRPTRADRAFTAALEMEDLGPDVRQAIDDLRTVYANEIDSMNQRIAQSIRKSEPERLKQDAVRASGLLNGGGGAFFGGGPEDPSDALFEKRGEMTDNYVKRLAALLTPEQAAKLPRGTGRDDGRRQGPFGSWTISEMPEEARATAKAADKDGNGIIEGDERRELFRSMRPPDEGQGGGGDAGGGRGGTGGGGRRNRDNPG